MTDEVRRPKQRNYRQIAIRLIAGVLICWQLMIFLLPFIYDHYHPFEPPIVYSVEDQHYVNQLFHPTETDLAAQLAYFQDCRNAHEKLTNRWATTVKKLLDQPSPELIPILDELALQARDLPDGYLGMIQDIRFDLQYYHMYVDPVLIAFMCGDFDDQLLARLDQIKTNSKPQSADLMVAVVVEFCALVYRKQYSQAMVLYLQNPQSLQRGYGTIDIALENLITRGDNYRDYQTLVSNFNLILPDRFRLPVIFYHWQLWDRADSLADKAQVAYQLAHDYYYRRDYFSTNAKMCEAVLQFSSAAIKQPASEAERKKSLEILDVCVTRLATAAIVHQLYLRAALLYQQIIDQLAPLDESESGDKCSSCIYRYHQGQALLSAGYSDAVESLLRSAYADDQSLNSSNIARTIALSYQQRWNYLEAYHWRLRVYHYQHKLGEFRSIGGIELLYSAFLAGPIFIPQAIYLIMINGPIG